MVARGTSRGDAIRGLLLGLSLVFSLGAARPALAQLGSGDQVPSRLYFLSLPNYFDGNYRNALQTFQAENRSSLRAPGQWIDAIPSYVMSGECYYHMGQNQKALAQYEAALTLYVAYSDWLMRVQFGPTIVPALNAARATPWGQSKRGAAVGAFPETFLMSQGQLDQSRVLQQGGVLAPAMLFPVHVAEIVRSTTLAIRRRRDLLGPICKHDPLTNSVLDVLSRRPGPANHWSEAWVQVQLGCAQAAAGQLPQAKASLERAIMVSGQFDHPLTSTALVELARVSLDLGDYPAAARFAEEASYLHVNFPDLTNLEESFRLGLQAHLMLNQKGPYPPLAPAIAWSKSQAPRKLQTALLLMAAENMASLGEPAPASGFLTNARALMGRGDLLASRQGAQLNYLTALTHYETGGVPAGDQALDDALTFQRQGSLWAYQIAQSDERYVNGKISDRTGLLLYESVLRELTSLDWQSNPLECLSVLTTPQELVFEHWFELALKNAKEHDLALEIADRARRHRFYYTLPMGGRLLALRWILEGPTELLGERGLLERQDLLAHYPKYRQLADQVAKLRAALADQPLVADAPEGRRQQTDLLDQLASLSAEQEVILREIALRREPAEMVFPPQRKTKDVQQSLRPGQVLLAFFSTSNKLYGFLYSRDRYAAWHVQSPVQLRKQITLLLREMGNYEANHEIAPSDLSKSGWRTAGAKAMSLILEKSNVDLAGNFDEIVIVPDGLLWYLPFEALSIGPRDKQKLLISQARVRYAPTVGLAVPDGRTPKPEPKIGVVLGKLYPQDDGSSTVTAFEALAPAVTGTVALPRAQSQPTDTFRVLLDGLIVWDDNDPYVGPYDWTPLRAEKGKTAVSLASWMNLPWGGPETIILPGFHTSAESGIRKGQPTGEELFLTVCGLMASGSRTILISRWRPGGQSSFDLIREFAQELPHVAPAEAWQRSVQVASGTPLDLPREPRIKATPGAAGEGAKANHPFFWAGYLLVDSGQLEAGADPALELPGKPRPAAPAQPANPRAQAPGGAPRAMAVPAALPAPPKPGLNGADPAVGAEPAADAEPAAPRGAVTSKRAKAKVPAKKSSLRTKAS